jgi:hypothetical protein
MGQWEPLAGGIPLDMRRLATQLRRMKERSGLTVPGLAARTGHSAESWALTLAGRQIPPLAAVEVLAQASGADYDRIGALWHLADRAVTGPVGPAGAGERAGRPVPYPDPLDPLGPQEGLSGRRRWLLPALVGVLAAGALTAVMLTAGPSTGRAPSRAAATGPGPAAAPGSVSPSSAPTPRAPAGTVSGAAGPVPADPGTVPRRSAGPGPLPSGARSSSADASVPAWTGSPAAGPSATAASTPPGSPSASPSTAPSATPSSPAPSPAPGPIPGPIPGPARGGLCLDVLILDVCFG